MEALSLDLDFLSARTELKNLISLLTSLSTFDPGALDP